MRTARLFALAAQPSLLLLLLPRGWRACVGLWRLPVVAVRRLLESYKGGEVAGASAAGGDFQPTSEGGWG